MSSVDVGKESDVSFVTMPKKNGKGKDVIVTDLDGLQESN